VATVVEVPLNTSIADLDEVLRRMLKRELDRHGFQGVDVAFDAPSKDWSGKLTNPAVNLFLYDVREDLERGEVTGGEGTRNGSPVATRAPLHVELTYAVTAWTKAVEDEHRLLSQLLAIFVSHKRLPESLLDERPEQAARLRDVETTVGRPREEKADFWTSVGGQFKPSIDYVVRMAVESGAFFVRGPEVRMTKLRTRISDGPPGTLEEFQRVGGTVHDADGAPVADAWVVLPELGRWASTDRQGRFTFPRMAPGRVRIVARTAEGAEAETTVDLPEERADLVLGARRRRSAAR
jgi:hypothetical protein